MNNFKITYFQKNINESISKDQKQKINAQKSDFFIFPSFFPLKETHNLKQIAENEKIYLDSLLEISETYKGVIIGGSFPRVVDGQIIESCPIVQDIQLIDYYDTFQTQKEYGNKIQTRKGDSIYVLGKIRFGICLGDESKDPSILKFFQKEKIEVLFNPSFNINPVFEDYEKEQAEYFSISANYGLNIFKVTPVGKFINNQTLIGRSFHSSPTGIKWKVAESEKSLEIIKTVNINLQESILSFKG
jgi:predicted amidohydrolase